MASGDGENRRILVTGGSGMVGQVLKNLVTTTKYAKEKDSWIFVSSADADLTQFDQTKALFDKHRPTHVLHCAALVGGLYHNLSRNLDFLRTNMLMGDSVLYNSHLFSVKKVVSCLSTCIFPDNVRYPLDESMIHDGKPHASSYGYSYGKRALDAMNFCYHSQFGYKWTSVIPCNLYGPYDNFNLKDAHCIPGLIHKVYLAKRDNTPLEVWGTGAAQRQFTFTEDFARLLVWALDEYDSIEPLITSVGEDAEISIKDLIGLITRAMNFTGPVQYDSSKSDGQIRKTASNTKLMSLLPDFKFTPLDEGIRRTCDWFENNYDTLRK